MSKIELRLSNVDPPLPDPPRTIYRDIVNLPDPVKLGLTIRYFNYDDVTLYFQITGSGPGYTFGTVNLGSLGSGANAYMNLDEFASRAKPSASDLPNGEMEENITLILKAYTDSGYTNLKWTYERVVTVHWINSADPAFTVDVLNNFDDGTVQGWAAQNISNNYSGYPTLGVATDYVLSTPYSLKMTQLSGAAAAAVEGEIYKSFTTPNKSVVYAIMDVRNGAYYSQGSTGIYALWVYRDDVLLITLTGTASPYYDRIPRNKWMRIVVPLPPNTTIVLKIRQQQVSSSAGDSYYSYLWLDDFKIISK
jgi:hypothetical protein